MGLPKDLVKPAYNYTYGSERDYFDESTTALDDGVVADPEKSGADYGITDPQVTEPISGTDSETGNGGGEGGGEGGGGDDPESPPAG